MLVIIYFFVVILVIIDFHGLFRSPVIRSHQENTIYFLSSGLKLSLKMSSQILIVYKYCFKRNVLNLSQTFSQKDIKFFSCNMLYIVHK